MTSYHPSALQCGDLPSARGTSLKVLVMAATKSDLVPSGPGGVCAKTPYKAEASSRAMRSPVMHAPFKTGSRP